MSSINGYLVDQKLNKYHRMIEREKAEESYSSSLKNNSNNQYTSTEKTISGYSTSFSKYSNITPIKNMAPFSSNDDISILSLRSQRQSNSFLMDSQRRSKSPSFLDSQSSDSSDDLLKESTRVISKIERHTRSSSSSRAQSPVSSRSPNSQIKSSPTNSPKNSNQKDSDQDEDRDLQISDLEGSPKSSKQSDNNISNSPDRNSTLKNSINVLNNSDRTSPLKALKRGLSSLFMSQVNKKSKETDNYNYSSNRYQSTGIRTINTSSPRSRSLSSTNTSTYNSPSFMSSREKFDHSSWMKVPSRHSPNFILSDGSNDSPTQKVYHSRSSSPTTSKNSPSYANMYNTNNTSKHRSLNNSNFNYYRSQNLNSKLENEFTSPNRNSPIRSRSPPSPSFKIRRDQLSSESESTEENFFNKNKTFSSYNKKPITANFNSNSKTAIKFDADDDDDTSSEVNDRKFNQFSNSSIQRNDDFSLKFSSSLQQRPILPRYADAGAADVSSSSETEEKYTLKYDQNGELKLPKAETKLTKKFSKQISNLLSPENQRTNGLLMFSDSDSSSSSNFHPKPPSRPISTINQNYSIFRASEKTVFNALSSSSSSDSLFDASKRKTATNLTNKPFKNFDSDSESSSNLNINRNQYSKSSTDRNSNFTSSYKQSNYRYNSGGYGQFNSHSFASNSQRPGSRLDDDSDSEDEFFNTLKKAIRENENVLNSIRH